MGNQNLFQQDDTVNHNLNLRLLLHRQFPGNWVGGRGSVVGRREGPFSPHFGFLTLGSLEGFRQPGGNSRVLYIPGSSSSTRVASSLLTQIVTAAWTCLPDLCIFHFGGHTEGVLLTRAFVSIFPNGSGLGEQYTG
jgi:hypothetical protein